MAPEPLGGDVDEVVMTGFDLERAWTCCSEGSSVLLSKVARSPRSTRASTWSFIKAIKRTDDEGRAGQAGAPVTDSRGSCRRRWA